MNILDQATILELFHSYYPLFVSTIFLCTFAFTFYLIPKVLWVSKEKNLMAQINDRSSHIEAIPSFGGVAFFVTLILLLSILQPLRLTDVGNHLIAGITILFMVGLKDDLVISTARVKFFGQVAAVCFLVFSPELQLDNLRGFWGIYEIPAILGYSIKAFIAIALINAYNLIDGIDGLAAMIGIVIAGIYGCIFHISGNSYFLLVCVGVIGILSAFLRYNFSRGRKKIFMGDSGSLVIGLILAFLTMKILVMAPVPEFIAQGHDPANRLLLIACVLFIPAFDTLRVMIIRMLNKRSPFSADRNHLHHILLDLGFSHFRAGLCLAFLNLLVVGLYLYFSTQATNLWLSFIVVLFFGCGFLLFDQLKLLSRQKASPTHAGPLSRGIKMVTLDRFFQNGENSSR